MVQGESGRKMSSPKAGRLACRVRQTAVIAAWIAALGTGVGYFFPGATAAAKSAVVEGSLSFTEAWGRLDGAEMDGPTPTALAGTVVIISNSQ